MAVEEATDDLGQMSLKRESPLLFVVPAITFSSLHLVVFLWSMSIRGLLPMMMKSKIGVLLLLTM